MKLALLSDLHANLPALLACLAHARDRGADQLAILGDLVGYGAQPAEVVEQVAQLQAQGAIVLRGNHDEAAAQPPPPDNLSQPAASARWTHGQLSPSQHAWLRSLPMDASQAHWLLVHASAHQPQRWPYVDDERAADACLTAAQARDGAIRHVFCGHVHHQRVFYRGVGRGLMRFEPHAGVPVALPGHRAWACTVGSVGQPRDGDPRAMYALFDTQAGSVCFHRVPYDVPAACLALRQSSLPPALAQALAQRLEDGR